MFLSYFWFRSLWLKKKLHANTPHLLFLLCSDAVAAADPVLSTVSPPRLLLLSTNIHIHLQTPILCGLWSLSVNTYTHAHVLNTQTNHSFVRRLSLENKNTSTPILITLNSPTLADGHAWCSLHSLRYVCQIFSFIFNFETKPMKVLNLAFIRRYLFQPIP